MNKYGTVLFILAIFTIFFTDAATAKTGYVSDVLLLTFREGPGNTFEVLKTLKSNTRLKILEEDQGYLKVQLDSGDIGWVDKKYIIYELPAALVAQKLRAEKAQLEAQVEKLQTMSESQGAQITELNQTHGQQTQGLDARIRQLESENLSLATALKKSQQEYETLVSKSKNIQQIIQENDRFKDENATISQAYETLEKKHNNSFRTSMIKWALAGVAVLLFGWLLGNTVPQKKSRSGSLLD